MYIATSIHPMTRIEVAAVAKTHFGVGAEGANKVDLGAWRA